MYNGGMHDSHVQQLVLVPSQKEQQEKMYWNIKPLKLATILKFVHMFQQKFLFSLFYHKFFHLWKLFETDGGLFYFIMTNNVTKSIIFYYSYPLSQLILKILFRCPT